MAEKSKINIIVTKWIKIIPMKKLEELESYLIERKGSSNFSEEKLNLLLVKALQEINPGKDYTGFSFESANGDDLKLVTASFAKLLVCREKYLGNFYFKIMKIFDNTFHSNLYKRQNLDIRSQNYEKSKAIKEILENMEKQIEKLISSFNDLNIVNSFRQELMKLINTFEFKYLCSPFFLSDSLFDRFQLDTIFNFIKDFSNSKSNVEQREIYNKVKKVLDDCIGTAKISKLAYSEKFIVPFGEKVFELIKNATFGSAAGKANLKIKTVDKKYPLNEHGKFDILVKIVNHGTGFAENVKLGFSSNDVIIEKSKFVIPTIELSPRNIEIPVILPNIKKLVNLTCEFSWSNFDGSLIHNSTKLILHSQSTGIIWDELMKKEPYSILPVEEKDKLIGRTKLLEDLINKTKNENVGSCFLYGQKRVGKTSIVKTLKNCFSVEDDYAVVYLDGTTVRQTNAIDTINAIGKGLCRNLRRLSPSFRNVEIPEFNGSLTPLLEYFEEIWNINPNLKFLLIIDEFDEFPIEIYQRGPIGDTLFNNLRGLTNENKIGFILVGSENIKKIISMQGYRGNNWDVKKVDVFNYETEYSSFSALIKKPVEDNFEYSDEAIEYIYRLTCGNPYFANIICDKIFRMGCEKRDAFVSYNEVDQAARKVIEEASENRFQHYWEDGILENPHKKEEISITRRRILIAIAEVIRKIEGAKRVFSFQEVLKQFTPSELSSEDKQTICKREIRDLLNREIIDEADKKGGIIYYRFTTKLFEKWLINRGVFQIMTTFQDIGDILAKKIEDEKLYIQSIEIEKSIHHITFEGKKITESDVRKWLGQFGSNHDQRIIFDQLKAVKYYSNDAIQEFILNAHQNFHRQLDLEKHVRVQEKESLYIEKNNLRKRSDILVLYFNEHDKGLAKKYAEKHEIYVDMVVWMQKINIDLTKRIKSIILFSSLIDNCEYLITEINKTWDDIKDIVGEKKVAFSLATFCIFHDSLKTLKENAKRNLIPMDIYFDKIIEPGNSILLKNFTNSALMLKVINQAFHSKIVEHTDRSVNLVFEHFCPQASLPIYWFSDEEWIPLFPNKSKIEPSYSSNEQYRILCYPLGSGLEKIMLEKIVAFLKNKYGEKDDQWWVKGVSLNAREKCSTRWESQDRKDNVWNYLEILDFKGIVKKHVELKSLFYVDLENMDKRYDKLSTEKALAWIDEFNEVRKKYAHASRLPPTHGDYQFMKKIHKWFFENLKKIESERN